MSYNIELDLISESRGVDSKRISTEDEGIQFSKAVLALLKDKVKTHNVSYGKKITLSQLKDVYLKGSRGFSTEKTNGFLGMARVNMYLRILAADGENQVSFKNIKDINISFLEIDLTENWLPSEVDTELTIQESFAHNIDKNFDEGDLYFQNEEPLMFADSLRNLI